MARLYKYTPAEIAAMTPDVQAMMLGGRLGGQQAITFATWEDYCDWKAAKGLVG